MVINNHAYLVILCFIYDLHKGRFNVVVWNDISNRSKAPTVNCLPPDVCNTNESRFQGDRKIVCRVSPKSRKITQGYFIYTEHLDRHHVATQKVHASRSSACSASLSAVQSGGSKLQPLNAIGVPFLQKERK